MNVKKGDQFRWTEHGADLAVTVWRVSSLGQWADIFVYDNSTRTSWTKRQPLPFPENFERVTA